MHATHFAHPYRRPRRFVAPPRPQMHLWHARADDSDWLRGEALAYLRWRMHGRVKHWENSAGLVWCGYLFVFFCWCMVSIFAPHLPVLSRQGSTPDVVTRALLAGLLPTLLCMSALSSYSHMLAARRNRLHNQVSLTATAGLLADLLRDTHDRDGVLSALTALLPHLHGADRGMLNARRMEMLLAALRRDHAEHPTFALALLHALSRIGERSALPVVAHLAQTTADPDIARAAQTCLDALHLHFDRQRDETALLRASEDNLSDTMLRSAALRPDQEAAQLLRVSKE